MGDAAEMVLEGILCEECGEYIGDAVGYPRKCDSCGGEDEGPSDEELEALEADGVDEADFFDDPNDDDFGGEPDEED